MRKKLVALLLCLVLVCTSAVALAAVQVPEPTLTATEVSVPDNINTETGSFVKSVDALGDNTYRIYFKSNPFDRGTVVYDEYGDVQSGLSYTEVWLEFDCVGTDGDYRQAWILQEDIKKASDGTFYADYNFYNPDGGELNLSYRSESIYRNYLIDGWDNYYTVVSDYDANGTMLKGSLYGYVYDDGDYSYYYYSYGKGGALTYYRAEIGDERLNVYYDKNDGELTECDYYQYIRNEDGDTVAYMDVTYNGYGYMKYASYSDWTTGVYYSWDSAAGQWEYWDDEIGSYVHVELDGVPNPEELELVAKKALPELVVAKNASALNQLSVSPFQFAAIKSYSAKDGVLTITFSKSITDYGNIELNGVDDYIGFNFNTGYYLNGDYFNGYYGSYDCTVSEDGKTVTIAVPEGSEFEYVDVSYYGYINDQWMNFWRSESGAGASATIKNIYYSYSYDEDGNITGATIEMPDGNYYYFYYSPETGDLIRYQYEVENGLYVTFDLENGPVSAYYWDPETGAFYNWDSEIGWFEYQYNEETGEYEKVPVDGPEGVMDPADAEPLVPVKPDVVWFPNNTVGVLGLSLRDDLGLSDKWYNIVPVDLTIEGTQTFPMVAANMFYFGSATVTVADGNVTVDYTLPKGHAYLKDECLQWFTSLDEITSAFTSNPVGEYTFGEPVSISEELNGQDVALLFICNHVTYRQPITSTAMLTRYYNTQERWVNWRAALTELLDSMDAAEAVEETEGANE